MQRVLLVDDDDAVRLALEQLLTREGWEVVAAASVDDAERAFAARPCDVVLSDMVMPGKDAFDLLKELRKSDPRLAFVVLSGYLTDEKFKSVLQAGATDCLNKPCESDDLVRALCRAIVLRNCAPACTHPEQEHAISVQVPAQLKQRLSVIQHVDTAAQAGGFDLRRNRILMALDEAFSNAVIHGVGGNPKAIIQVSASFSAAGGVVTVSDSGPGFDPTLTEFMKDETHRQRGLYLIRAACDDVRWLGRGNICQMVFRQPAAHKDRSAKDSSTRVSAAHLTPARDPVSSTTSKQRKKAISTKIFAVRK
jgi:DNA-binding NarL/FixJ family response regulator